MNHKIVAYQMIGGNEWLEYSSEELNLVKIMELSYLEDVHFDFNW